MQIEQPLFTVATITYNSGKWVSQAIESILSSSLSDFELLISDDCSTDNTWEIIQKYKDPRINAWQNDTNIGEYPNRNKVLKESKGKYLIFVDGDDILYSNTLRNLSEFTKYFPDAGMIWGLNPQHFPFYVFPFLVKPEEVFRLIYKTTIPISNIGFGEIVFNAELLKDLGGMSEKYKMGDTYIKKKMALTNPVLFVPIGLMFWRQSPNQASKKIAVGLNGFFERMRIDNEILNNPTFPLSGKDKLQIQKNLRISTIKIFISSTILKGQFVDFFRFQSLIDWKFSDLILFFTKGDYTFLPQKEFDKPLKNKYNFEKFLHDTKVD